MDSYSLAEAKAQLSAIIDRVEAGERVEIKRRGRPVAVVMPIAQPKQPFDWEALAAFREGLPHDPTNSVAEMRKLDRY